MTNKKLEIPKLCYMEFFKPTEEQIKEIENGLTNDEWKRPVICLPGDRVEFIPFYQERAIAILRQIIEVDPFCDLTDYGNSDCFLCSESNPNHSPDCPYLLAKQLLDEIDEIDRLMNGDPESPIKFDGISGIINDVRPTTKIP